MASRNLRGKGLRASSKRQDFNPSEGILNLADVMLVFACGLMLSLVMNWNIDINVEEVVCPLATKLTRWKMLTTAWRKA